VPYNVTVRLKADTTCRITEAYVVSGFSRTVTAGRSTFSALYHVVFGFFSAGFAVFAFNEVMRAHDAG